MLQLQLSLFLCLAAKFLSATAAAERRPFPFSAFLLLSVFLPFSAFLPFLPSRPMPRRRLASLALPAVALPEKISIFRHKNDSNFFKNLTKVQLELKFLLSILLKKKFLKSVKSKLPLFLLPLPPLLLSHHLLLRPVPHPLLVLHRLLFLPLLHYPRPHRWRPLSKCPLSILQVTFSFPPPSFWKLNEILFNLRLKKYQFKLWKKIENLIHYIPSFWFDLWI